MFANCLSHISTENGLYASLFLGGLVGSLAHCSAMCGPLVMAQIGALPDSRKHSRAVMLVPYHLGRMSTYVFLAVLLHSFLNLAFLFSPLRGALSTLFLTMAALMFLINALPGLMRVFPWVVRLGLPIPLRLIQRMSRPFMMEPTGLRGYALGVLLGFMPCGLVVAALLATAAAPSALSAGGAMLVFWLGTVPVLMAIGCGAGWVKGHWALKMQTISSIVMLAGSLLLFWLAGRTIAL